MEWSNPASLRKKKFKTALRAGKIMVTGFWDEKAAIHKNFHLAGQQ
jgi:hypothetical protein